MAEKKRWWKKRAGRKAPGAEEVEPPREEPPAGEPGGTAPEREVELPVEETVDERGPGGPVGAVMVVGGGIGGIQASLDLVEMGYRVYLVDSGPSIGGVMSQLDKTFPT
ncbi:MAG: FAD-dependent oxidoreductase, partial [Actinomycetia bacterium]|nr:FAD-dependent oxidoreductase [Actinomycetes bacterium]